MQTGAAWHFGSLASSGPVSGPLYVTVDLPPGKVCFASVAVAVTEYVLGPVPPVSVPHVALTTLPRVTVCPVEQVASMIVGAAADASGVVQEGKSVTLSESEFVTTTSLPPLGSVQVPVSV